MDDFKAALKLCIDKSTADTKVGLMLEMLSILYASAFSDGQHYILERIEEDEGE